MVLARGRIPGLGPPAPLFTLAIEFFRTRFEELGGNPVVLSLRPCRGFEEVAPC
jgi:hypothetical protein